MINIQVRIQNTSRNIVLTFFLFLFGVFRPSRHTLNLRFSHTSIISVSRSRIPLWFSIQWIHVIFNDVPHRFNRSLKWLFLPFSLPLPRVQIGSDFTKRIHHLFVSDIFRFRNGLFLLFLLFVFSSASQHRYCPFKIYSSVLLGLLVRHPFLSLDLA